MENTTAVQPGTVALDPPSTVLNPQTVNTTSGAGKPALGAADKPQSIESVLDAELARLKADDAKAAEKDAAKPEAKADGKDAKPDAKAEKTDDKGAKIEDKPQTQQRARNEDGKFAKAEKQEGEQPINADAKAQKGAPDEAATGQEGSERDRQSEGRQHYDPPARFLPKEKELWANVPNTVKAAIDRVSREHEQEITQFRQSHEEWTKLDKFQQMAKQHNTTISDALERYTRIDGMLAQNPVAAIREILAMQGVTPEQYAQHVLQNPDVHRAPVQQQRAPDPAVQEMTTTVARLEQTIRGMQLEQAAASIIDPFRASHPRFDELQDDIGFFLQSGKIPASLSPPERLEAAYDMAERINPTSVSAPQIEARAPVAEKSDRPAKLDAGQKSIRGAPSDGSDEIVEEANSSLDAILRKELRKIVA